jgi:hypothetical protein
MSWPNLRWYVSRNRLYRMLSWRIIKWYVDWQGWDGKFSRPIWDNICTPTDLNGCCHDLIWSALWIGTDVKECCHDIIWRAMWIGKDVTGRFHDKYEVHCILEQILKYAVLTLFEVLSWLEKKWLEDFTTNFRYYVDCVRCKLMLS